MLFIKYLLNNNEKPKLQDIKAPDILFEGFRDPVKAAYDHERKVTESIKNIHAVACSQKDSHAMEFLDWFIHEQVEEEKNTEALVNRYDLFGNDAKGLSLLDAELATRVYAPATLVI
ncbi:MAG: ferritin [Bacillota bacterium]